MRRPTAWSLFVLLLILALAREHWDKNPLRLGSLQLPWPTFVLAMLVLPLTIGLRERRPAALLRLPKPLRPMLGFWLCCGLSVIAVIVAPASSLVQFLKTFLHLSLYVAFVCVVVRWMTWARLLVLVQAYYLFGIAAAMLGVLQYLHGGFGWFDGLAFIRLRSAEYAVGGGLTTGFRAASFFGEPSWAARYYVHFLALALAFWWYTGRGRHLGAVGVLLAAFYAANSLLGYVILGVFLASLAVAQVLPQNIFSLPSRGKAALAIAACACGILWLAGLVPRYPDLIGRSIARLELVVQGGGGAGNRFDSVYAGLEVWKRAPVLGVGLGNIGSYIVPFYRDPDWVLRSRYVSDSLYVQVLAETGIIGLLGFLWFWGRLIWFYAPARFLSRLPPQPAQGYVWLRFLQLDLFAQAVGMLSASDYLNPHLWTVVAIALTCKTLLLREARA